MNWLLRQGSFMVGGTKTTELGTFDVNNALKPDGQTFHGDHAYAFYQIPENAHKLPLVFLHGAGQSKKTWETTPDGREEERLKPAFFSKIYDAAPPAFDYSL